MAISGVNGTVFNPYTPGVGSPRSGDPAGRATTPHLPSQPATVTARSVADAIKSDASARTAQLSSAQAPDGVDQDLWSVLSKDERSFFMKAGAMGPLTYGRFSASQVPTPAPMLRGGRLDIKA